MIHPAGRERHMQAGMHAGGKKKKVLSEAEDKISGSLGKSHEKNQRL